MTDGSQDVILGPDALRARSASLFRFLRDLTALRTRATLTYGDETPLLWIADVPDEPECDRSAWRPRPSVPEPAPTTAATPTAAWLRVAKPALEDPPSPPAALAPWIVAASLQDSSRDAPEIIERLRTPIESQEPEGEPTIEEQVFDDEPTAQHNYRYFVRERWLPWALEDRRLRRVQRVYAALFAMQQRQLRYGESEQVVLGLALLDWPADGDSRPRRQRHLIAAEAAIEIDPRSGAITVGPGAEGAAPRFEQDMLEPNERPAPAQVAEFERRVRELGDGVVDAVDEVRAIASAWVHATSAEGRYEHDLDAARPTGRAPVVSFAPAILVRRRSDRALLNTFGEILEKLESGDEPVPFGVARYVSVDAQATRTADDPTADDDAAVGEADRDYLPLLANAEQRRVLDQLRQQQGVLVQGPPGTGKSHTIANLVCHLLATGQRVLVTSHTAHALEVLRDKLPAGFADLCVELLGAGRGAMQSLERSVQSITERQQGFDPSRSAAAIESFEAELQRASESGAEARLALRRVQEASAERHELTFEGETFAGTLMGLATELDVRPDEPLADALDEATEYPLDAAAHELLLGTRPGPRPSAEGARLWADDAFDPERRFAEERALEDAAQGTEIPTTAPDDATVATIARMAAAATELRDAWARVDRRGASAWLDRAAQEVLQGRDRTWQARANSARALGDALTDVATIDAHRIAGVDPSQRETLAADARALREHLEAGGGFGWLVFRSAVVKRTRGLWERVTVDGAPCRTIESLRALEAVLDADRALDALDALWADLDAVPPGARAVRAAAHAERLDELDAALALAPLQTTLAQACENSAAAPPDTSSRSAFDAWVELAIARRAAAQLARLRAQIERDAVTLESAHTPAHPDEAALAGALRDRDLAACRHGIERLTALDRLHMVIDAFVTAGAPLLAAQLRRGDPNVDRESLRGAWGAARARAFVRARIDPEHEATLRTRLEQASTEERSALGKLAEVRAWHHLLTGLDEHERQHLVAWTKAVRRIGKGTGKHAGRHRRAAREHMEQCRGAIPAWILPTYRVAESLRPGVDAFDVVIIDEASQSGPEALFLLYMCKKIIVVGDDKQISPDFVGITRDDVEHLRQRHLDGLPHADAYSLEHSLFDLAEIRYGNRIRLREHFRCMPEIIRFSNELCYASEPLVPLKQFGAGRLTPVVRTVHVEDGYRDGTGAKVFNPAEADAIVTQIAACHADPDYASKSMGVISLQGPHQAQLIEGKLMERLGPDAILERDLVCGDAYTFQGDERDVMFLSLVAAPHAEKRIGTLADQRSERRFNVAVSRAKEQMWLFHSATLADLSPKCLRHALLEYCMDPSARSTLPSGIDGDALRVAAQRADRRREAAPPPFDSWFEVDVCLALTARGFRVEPQFEVAGYRIDLVVVGAARRLAVECDGDAWHGAEQWQHDEARQRALERCGWTFCRIRGSAFYLDRETALLPMWCALEDLAIKPTTA